MNCAEHEALLVAATERHKTLELAIRLQAAHAREAEDRIGKLEDTLEELRAAIGPLVYSRTRERDDARLLVQNALRLIDTALEVDTVDTAP